MVTDSIATLLDELMGVFSFIEPSETGSLRFGLRDGKTLNDVEALEPVLKQYLSQCHVDFAETPSVRSNEDGTWNIDCKELPAARMNEDGTWSVV